MTKRYSRILFRGFQADLGRKLLNNESRGGAGAGEGLGGSTDSTPLG